LAAGNGSVVQGYIADVTPARDRAGRIALLGAAYNIGFIFGPAVGGLLAHPTAGPEGFRLPLLTSSALAAVSATCIAFIVKESQTLSQSSASQLSRWAMFGKAIAHPVISRLMLLTLVAGLAFNGIEATFGFWAQARYGWGPRDVSFCFTAAAFVSVIAQATLSGRLSTRFGQATILAAGMAITVVCAGLQPFAVGGWMTVFLMAAMSLSLSVAFPNASAMISRTTDPDHQGQMLGLNNASDALARVMGPMIALTLFSSVDHNAPFFAGAGVVIPAIALAIAAGQAARKLGPLDRPVLD
ncbi:MAG TPA: MFS transporter, partial [Caulobacteraceae bacterium]|nr:MFS transporter [Caulobacteraceae bacterium]